jgi:hypothetical protein
MECDRLFKEAIEEGLYNLRRFQAGINMEVDLSALPVQKINSTLYRVNSKRHLPKDIDITSMEVGEIREIKTNVNTSLSEDFVNTQAQKKKKAGNMFHSTASFSGPKEVIDVNSILGNNKYSHQEEAILKKGTKIKLVGKSQSHYDFEVL